MNQTAIFPSKTAETLLLATAEALPPGIEGYWTPSSGQLNNLEAGLAEYALIQRDALSRRYRGGPTDLSALPPWSHYRRQATGVIRSGKRQIFVSYYPYGPPEAHARRDAEHQAKRNKDGRPASLDAWKTEPLTVLDGGPAYFRVLYDCDSRTFVWYEENGA
ncbi:MAG TPA: hypothetical protein VEB66_03710 [Opitutaceae bacterium]|nr:hypothetical protein [Opitutaceae bacterium]